uniref:Nucleolus and neural progenitor protein n=1 Tax=Monodelphis domestica TaxID=13616 RepID=A0A5F8GKM9_MONDO
MASVADREPWNQVRIPSPGSLSTVAVEDEDGAIGSYIKAVIKECHTVKMSLIRKDLDAETGVLRAILYSNHNKLCHHKPYLALKQLYLLQLLTHSQGSLHWETSYFFV